MPKKTTNPTSGSDALYIFLAGIYIMSRPLLESPTIIDIAIGAPLILMAIKLYIIEKKSK